MRKITMSGLMFIFTILVCFGIVLFTKEKFFNPLFSPMLGFSALMHSFWVEETTKEN